MKMLNVRLSDADAKAVRRLRERGVVVSEFVRAALRQEDAKHPPRKKRTVKELRNLLDEVYAEFPICQEEQERMDKVPSTLDRKAFAAYVAKRIQRGVPR